MADDEEKAKAEKLAAAKKRVAQLQKQKAKKTGKKTNTGEASKDEAPPTEASGKDSDDTHEGETIDSKPAPEQEDEQTGKGDESATEPMPDAPTSPGPEMGLGAVKELPSRGSHARQPSLSVQSKMRSSSFRTAMSSTTSPGAGVKSPPLPPLTPDNQQIHEVFRKQAARVEELEKDNKRLEKDLEDANSRRQKSEEQLEDLREASVEVIELKDRLDKAEQQVAEIEKLKADITSLQRQNSLLQSKSHRSANASATGTSDSPPSDVVEQLESKSATIDAMGIEISNLRAQLQSQSDSSSSYRHRISALEETIAQSERALEKTQRELADSKQSLSRASEKAMKEGVDKTSTDTLIKSLRREIEELQDAKSTAEKKIETLDKKLQALGNLHKESEIRHQTRLKDSEKLEREVAVLKKKLTTTENENLRLREERERAKKREAMGGDDEGLDELEDEERACLERRVRDLEGENFDLRRGVWKERKQELEGDSEGEALDTSVSSGGNFDEVDLFGGASNHSRRRSLMAAGRSQQQQHSSFSTVISSGIAAFTGGNNNNGDGRRPSNQHRPPAARGNLELLTEENDEFDEDAFARAQAEEELRKKVEWVREVKRKLRDWKGWRLDLVDSRAGAEGAGVGMGEIFEV